VKFVFIGPAAAGFVVKRDPVVSLEVEGFTKPIRVISFIRGLEFSVAAEPLWVIGG